VADDSDGDEAIEDLQETGFDMSDSTAEVLHLPIVLLLMCNCSVDVLTVY